LHKATCEDPEWTKNKFSKEQLEKLGLNERQMKAVFHVIEHGSITNAMYQEINSLGKTVATEELRELVSKGILKQTGLKGRGSKYSLNE
jgi:ATP-dependent DNA helicase RecG